MCKLLSRDNFREGVFARDNHKCVICGEPAIDAHHILERRLFHDGGYYLDNGSSLCNVHHLGAEMTAISCEEIRTACGIDKIILPSHFTSDFKYDKWGNIVLATGGRIKGEMFYDESVQKILSWGSALDSFKKYIKYPRTYHLPWSHGTSDDKILKDESVFDGYEVVVTLKMDGENTSMYDDYIHARSLDLSKHESRTLIKQLHARIKYELADNWRICGENMYAVHSIQYDDLPSVFLMFSFWIDQVCQSWDDTVMYAEMLGLETVPVIYRGKYDQKSIVDAFKPYEKDHEGYVVRISDEFPYMAFKESVAKYVRPEFKEMVDNSEGHWMTKKVITNNFKI